MEPIYRETAKRLDLALKHADETRSVLIGEQMFPRTAACFRECYNEKRAVVIADAATWKAAGQMLQNRLLAEGLSLESPFIFPDKPVHADRRQADRLRDFLAQTEAVPIAVGSGTINDLTKLASHETGRRYMVFGTAASMDGYTAFGASVESGGFKQTFSCPAPLAVVIDLDVLRDAPLEMSAAGYADLIAKIPAGADWMLADFIGTEPIDRAAWTLVQEHLRDWLQEPEGIVRRDKHSLLRLIEGLLMSGLAMQKAKSSRTASGAEHLFSHLWDNQHHTFNGRAPSHGFKVGIGTITTSALYEAVLRLDKEDLVRARTRFREESAHAPRCWSDVETRIRHHFGDGELSKQVRAQSRQKFTDTGECSRRFDLYIEHWESLRKKIREQLLPAKQVQEWIRTCGAPAEPEQIGIDRPRLLLSFEQAQLIRCRYNILDFARETGLWDELVPPLFQGTGFWGS